MDDLPVVNSNELFDVIIIGGGPAGSTAALYTARAELKTLVIDKGVTAGALGMTNKIANYPGFVDEITGADLVQKMRDHAKKFGAVYVSDRVQAVDLISETKSIYANNATYSGKTVVIATGSMGRGRLFPGEEKFLGKGVSYCATCDGAFFKGKDVAVVGTSDEAVEESLFLTKFANQVHFIAPSELKAPKSLADELLENSKVVFHPKTTVREVFGGEKLEGLHIKDDNDEIKLPIQGAFFYTQGSKPVTDFLMGQIPTAESGCIPVNSEYKTELDGVYAVGDVICSHTRQVVVSAAEGAVAGIAIEKKLRGKARATPDWK